MRTLFFCVVFVRLQLITECLNSTCQLLDIKCEKLENSSSPHGNKTNQCQNTSCESNAMNEGDTTGECNDYFFRILSYVGAQHELKTRFPAHWFSCFSLQGKTFTIDGFKIEYEDLNIFSFFLKFYIELVAIEEIYITGLPITIPSAKSLQMFFLNFSDSLKILHFSSCQFECFSETLFDFSELKSLYNFSIIDANLGVRIFGIIERLPSELASLNISNNNLHSDEKNLYFSAFSYLVTLTKLTSLYLHNCYLKDADCELIFKLCYLRELDLSKNNLTYRAFDTVMESGITFLDISFNKINMNKIILNDEFLNINSDAKPSFQLNSFFAKFPYLKIFHFDENSMTFKSVIEYLSFKKRFIKNNLNEGVKYSISISSVKQTDFVSTVNDISLMVLNQSTFMSSIDYCTEILKSNLDFIYNLSDITVKAISLSHSVDKFSSQN